MLILMKPASNPDAITLVCRAVEALGLVPHPIPGATRVAIGVTGNTGPVDETPIRGLPGVVDVIRNLLDRTSSRAASPSCAVRP